MAKDDHILIEEAFEQKRMSKRTFMRLAGTHAELAARPGYYSEIVEQQLEH